MNNTAKKSIDKPNLKDTDNLLYVQKNQEKNRPNATKIRTIWLYSQMTQKEFAKLIGVNINTVYNWITLRREPTNLETLMIERIVSEKIGCITNSALIRSMTEEELKKFIIDNRNADWKSFIHEIIKSHINNCEITTVDEIKVASDEKLVSILEELSSDYQIQTNEKNSTLTE